MHSVYSNPVRQLHLNLPTSPNQGEDYKVTDMSLSSEASSSKTPGFDTYLKQKSFTTPTVEEEDQEQLPDEADTSHEFIDEDSSTHPRLNLKLSVSSTLDEEDEDDNLDRGGRGVGGRKSNNNNEYHGESSDDMLDTLDRAVTQLWRNSNGNTRRRSPMTSSSSNPFPCRR